MPVFRFLLPALLFVFTISLTPTFFLSDTLAYPAFFDSRCFSCHQDDTPTCIGCHFHRGNLAAYSDQDGYLPGNIVTITLNGGHLSGWIRGILYDENGLEIARASGPTGTGDDSLGSPVTFPVTLRAPAPAVPGLYSWEAAWFGSVNSGGGTHTESRVPVPIMVRDLPSSVPQDPPFPVHLTWGRIKALFH